MADWKHAWRRYVYAIIASEIHSLAAYDDDVCYFDDAPSDHGQLPAELKSRQANVRSVASVAVMPDFSTDRSRRATLVLNGHFNHSLDIQALLESLRPKLNRSSRVAVVAYNPYLRPLFRLANLLGFRAAEVPNTFPTRSSLEAIAEVAGYRLVRIRPCVYSPWKLLGIGSFLNWILPAVPLLRWVALTNVLVFKPVIPETTRPSISIIVPARNEQGNIERILQSIPGFDAPAEVVFVENNSSDGTYEEILRQAERFRHRFQITALQRSERGKVGAVRMGFEKASGDLLVILDADLTTPAELLPRFYEAWRRGAADFINGDRLVYPMEVEAMRPLNRLGNIFFAKALSAVLGIRIGDSLCGTKLFSRADYHRMRRWREEFGDFDPFGDFEFLFPSAQLGFGVLDLPVHYKARTYGSTNIRRFRDGLYLFRMTLTGLVRIKAGRLPS